VNVAFEPARVEYTQAYDNSLFFSPRFQEYARSLAESLIRRYSLHNRDIVDVGCGKGDFLLLLCELGKNRGVGFDPAHVEEEKHRAARNQVKFIQDYYSERYAHYPADLIICSQVLEHVYDPKVFLTMIRRVIGSRLGTHVFFEVPNSLNIFPGLDPWAIIYEHCSYFTPISLARSFSSAGFCVCELTEEFDGLSLAVYAQPNGEKTPAYDPETSVEIDRIAREIALFAAYHQRKVEAWTLKLEQIREKGQRAVIWGTGARGVTFLNVFKDLGIEYAVDINPRKQGLYTPRVGQQIVSPEFLKNYQPDVIIVMNPIYRKEIKQSTKTLGLNSKLMNA
jgi:2-polyprenyl-3-methyl-5-hydroxy-6-metoxy-1,4-benzoquinol methylase